jgi:hypothetical protein
MIIWLVLSIFHVHLPGIAQYTEWFALCCTCSSMYSNNIYYIYIYINIRSTAVYLEFWAVFASCRKMEGLSVGRKMDVGIQQGLSSKPVEVRGLQTSTKLLEFSSTQCSWIFGYLYTLKWWWWWWCLQISTCTIRYRYGLYIAPILHPRMWNLRCSRTLRTWPHGQWLTIPKMSCTNWLLDVQTHPTMETLQTALKKAESISIIFMIFCTMFSMSHMLFFKFCW